MALCICGILWNIKVMMTVSLRTCRLYVWIHRKNELEAYFWRQICLMKEFVLTILCRTNIIKMVFYFTVNRTQVFWNLRNCKGYSCTYPPPLSISKGNTRVTDSKTCRPPPPQSFFLNNYVKQHAVYPETDKLSSSAHRSNQTWLTFYARAFLFHQTNKHNILNKWWQMLIFSFIL